MLVVGLDFLVSCVVAEAMWGMLVVSVLGESFVSQDFSSWIVHLALQDFCPSLQHPASLGFLLALLVSWGFYPLEAFLVSWDFCPFQEHLVSLDFFPQLVPYNLLAIPVHVPVSYVC